MAKEDEKKEDEKLTPVGDGVESPEKEETEEKEEKKKADGEETDERVGHGEEEEPEDEPGDESDPERQKIRERRKREKQKRQERIQRERRELDFLRRRNDDLERKLSHVVLRQDQQETVVIDGRITHLESQIREAESIHTAAVEAKDGATATEALRVREELRDTLGKLKGGKESRARERQQAQETGDQPDPRAVRNGKDWVSRNAEWFDPELNDDDSFLARAVEERMAREGRFNPATPEYWEELDRRLEARGLGSRDRKSANGKESGEDVDWEDDDTRKPSQKKPAKKPSGPRIAVGGKTRTLKPNEVYISEQRKQAMIEAGVWDDEATRERYLKSYKRYDEEAAQRNS